MPARKRRQMDVSGCRPRKNISVGLLGDASVSSASLARVGGKSKRLGEQRIAHVARWFLHDPCHQRVENHTESSPGGHARGAKVVAIHGEVGKLDRIVKGRA